MVMPDDVSRLSLNGGSFMTEFGKSCGCCRVQYSVLGLPVEICTNWLEHPYQQQSIGWAVDNLWVGDRVEDQGSSGLV